MKPVIHRRSFDRAAVHYADHAVVQEEAADRLLERLAHFQPKGGDILDLGCGPLANSARLAQQMPGARVVSLDWSAAMLATGESPPVPGSGPVRADMHAVPLATACLDIVFANLSLSWSPDPAAVFGEVRRVLRPGGLFLFSLYGPDTLAELHAAWSAVDDRPHVNGHVDMHDVGDHLVAAGFRDPVMDRDILTLEYSALDRLMQDLRGVGSQVVDPRRRAALTGPRRMRAMLDAYAATGTDGRFPATFELVFGAAASPAEGQPVRTPEGDEARFSIDSLRNSRR